MTALAVRRDRQMSVENDITGVHKVASIPLSYTAVSPGEVWLLQALELGFSPPAVESGLRGRQWSGL